MRTDYIRNINEREKDYYLLVIDKNGKIHFANSHLVSNLNLRSEKLLQYNFFNFLEPRRLEGFKEVMNQVESTASQRTIETSIRNGSLHWIKWEVSKYSAKNGDTQKYYCIGYDILDKSRVKKMKQVARKHYESIMEGLTIGVILQDNQGEVLASNQKTAEIFEISIEELYETGLIKSLWKSFAGKEGNLEYTASPTYQALETGQLQKNISLNYITKSGKKKTILVNSQPLFQEDNEEGMTVVTSFTDVSRERELEEAVVQRDVMFQTLKDNSPSLSWIVDEDARLLFMNKSFASFFSLDQEAIGKNVLSMVPHEISTYLEVVSRNVLATGEPFNSREKYNKIDGTETTFWISIFPVPAVSERRMLGGYALDVTQQMKAQEELKSVNERLFNFSTITKDAIWEWDIRSGKIARNKVLVDLIGYTFANSKSLNWWLRRVHPDDRVKVRDIVRQVLKNRELSWEAEYRFQTASGEYIVVFNRGFIFYDNNEPVKIIGSINDISKVRQLEERLIAEKAQKQKDLTDTIFAVQEKERTRIGQELHDNVNQILGASKLFLSLLKTASEEDEKMKAKISSHLVMAIEEIRKLSREMVTPRLTENGLIASINSLVNDLKCTQVINILFLHHDDVEMISQAKKVTLFRIIQEQVKNTLKYSKARNLWITLKVADNRVQLVIEDDGVGFDTQKNRTGIGISNIYERSRFYNGKMVLKSSPGNGCKMKVYIPL